MTSWLGSENFPSSSSRESDILAAELAKILAHDLTHDLFRLMANYQKILADNKKRGEWPAINKKLEILFKCGKPMLLDGPMIGIPVSIRDSDYFKDTVAHLGEDRSRIASIEWMATAWNLTFADAGLWMGKTFEPVAREVVVEKCGHARDVVADFDPAVSRIGRNFFREPAEPNLLQSLGIPVLTEVWRLAERPATVDRKLFGGTLLPENLAKEKVIPYSRTGGVFLCNFGSSVVAEMNGKKVYQLNYRWPKLNPSYPMTRLIDELVQIGDGIYLGQLIYATRHYSYGSLRLPFCPELPDISLGEPYNPALQGIGRAVHKVLAGGNDYYGYQNNGYFLMMDPAQAERVYADDVFPQLRPRRGESGYEELGYGRKTTAPVGRSIGTPPKEGIDWGNGWRDNPELLRKFTTMLTEPSPRESEDGDVRELRRDGESVLQMLQRISHDISAQSRYDDHLSHFESLHRLFRAGIPPTVQDGVFRGSGTKGYNVRVDSEESNDWYGRQERSCGFDYYHGANLNLHLGFRDTFRPDIDARFDKSMLFPSCLADILGKEKFPSVNLLNMAWHSIGKYIFPWAGKSFERISGRRLSMMLDESSDLVHRYPARVHELKTHAASAPHYDLVLKNQQGYWKTEGPYAKHLKSGSWDQGMSDADKAFWEQEAASHWVYGNNIQDARIVNFDPLLRTIDMNYHIPDPSLQAVVDQGPSPFARQGYIFLGVSGRESILPITNGPKKKKKVFQFHYRYPMIGGPVPIGFCLDQLVEIADGLFLGQLIYATALHVPYHSSVDSTEYKYQLFGYFLLLDNDWQRHRLAIKLDTLDCCMT
jgi:hypothetical protein